MVHTQKQKSPHFLISDLNLATELQSSKVIFLIYRVGQKTAHGFHCNNFAYSQSIFYNFWYIYTTGNLQLDDA